MSPSMPSGAVLTRDEWEAACEILGEHEVPLLYDSAMERLLFDDRPLVHPLHFEGMADRTVIAGSLSKEHRMIGWRVGLGGRPGRAASSRSAGCTSTTPRRRPASRRAAATAVLRGDQGHVAERPESSSAGATRSWPRSTAGRWSARPAAGRC